jgi:hypothetical protein
MPSRLRIGLVGPDRTQPCGVADYTARLGEALAAECDLVFVPFRDALNSGSLDGCKAVLVQYERSLVPDAEFLPILAARHPGRVFVVPHEVYAEDPFAFPYSALRSAFPPLLWLKRLRYRLAHREYARERALQARAYGAHRVIPLSGPNAEVLRALAAGTGSADRILDPVPHAVFSPPEAPGDVPARGDFFPAGIRSVIGIFGFLNPGLDYGAALDLLASLGPDAGLLILGGPRAGAAGSAGDVEAWLSGEAAGRGLQGRVQVTGYVPEASLAAHLRLCDLFLAPMRFKSNSGSLLHLFGLGKPILASDLPLTRWLRGQGAPLELYADREELRAKALAALAPGYQALPNGYDWSFSAAASAYLRLLASAS